MQNKSIAIRRYFCKKSNFKTFDDIPGPRGPLGLGTMYNYFPVIGKYSWNELHKTGFKKYLKWGPIVRETIVPKVDVLWLFDPNDILKVLNEPQGSHPQRRSHLALEKYRKDRKHIYKNGGLLPTNGEEWWRIRSQFQKGLSSPHYVRNFAADTDSITKEFVFNLKETNSVKTIVPDFLPELSRLNLEIVCFLVFDVRLNSFSDKERQPNSRTTKLIESAEMTNSCILPTDQGLQLWRFFETPVYRKLRIAQDYMESVAIDLVSPKINLFNEKPQPSTNNFKSDSKSLLQEYIKNPNIDLSDIIGMASDMLLAGIDTTTYTTCFALYHLAKNQLIQERVYNETCKLLPSANDTLPAELLNNNATYIRAALKESLRLNPISVGVGRTLNQDTVLSGYMVPKGTNAVTQNFVACRLATNFKDPEKFIPERWLRNKTDINQQSINPYLSLPFGHGSRSCIARRLAEQSILILIIRIIRNFKIDWAGSAYMDVKTHLINKPDQPVKLTFIRRKN